MSVPELTPQARAAAAARGVAARTLRAQVRRELNSGDAKIRDVLLAGQEHDDRGRILARMRVADLLSSFRGIGPIRAATIMERIGIAPNRRIGGLGERQIVELSMLIEKRYAEGPAEPEAAADGAGGLGPGARPGPAGPGPAGPGPARSGAPGSGPAGAGRQLPTGGTASPGPAVRRTADGPGRPRPATGPGQPGLGAPSGAWRHPRSQQAQRGAPPLGAQRRFGPPGADG